MGSSIEDDPLVKAASEYARSYMSNYDASHGFDHVQRVLRLALHIHARSSPAPQQQQSPLDLRAIALSALLHDVGDRKYLEPTDGDPETMVYRVLRDRLAAPDALARKVQAICLGVSYSAEVRDPERAARLLREHPELAVVQDADRIDAVGAVGIGRLFAYGGARTTRDLAGSMGHLDEKLLRLEGMAKTEPGRQIVRERTERLRLFRQWWVEEAGAPGE